MNPNVGQQIRKIRLHGHHSLGDIEKSTGLSRDYISRVETGHVVPATDHLEKLAQALNVPVIQLASDETKPPIPAQGAPRSKLAKCEATSKASEQDALMIALQQLGNRWTLIVIRQLFDGPLRFSEIQRAVPEVPVKSLSRVLHCLQEEGLVQRKVEPSSPPQVSYSMVQSDPNLRRIIDALCKWGRTRL
jgi:DNA-binding HxlR family transcriptional regulator